MLQARPETLAILILVPLLAGCGTASPACTPLVYRIEVNPSSAVADHAASSPSNQVKYLEISTPQTEPNSCPVPAVIPVLQPVWSLSDTVSAQISNLNDPTNGTATCLAAASAPITVTATLGSGPTASVRTASLTCK